MQGSFGRESRKENEDSGITQHIKNACGPNNSVYFVRTYSDTKTPTQWLPVKGKVMQVQCGARRG